MNNTVEIETPEIRLARINATLGARNLKSLPKLGDHREGEFEIVDIIEIYDHSKQFFTDVRFSVIMPNGNNGAFTVRFNANGATSDGAVIVTIINGKFAIVKQWRVPLARWTMEVPRGFNDKLVQAALRSDDNSGESGGIVGAPKLSITDLPLATIVRELTADVVNSGRVVSVANLGNIAENSGTHAVSPGFFLVQLEVDEAKLGARLKGTDELKMQLWDASRVRQEFGGKLADMHTITGLALAMRHIEQLPRLS